MADRLPLHHKNGLLVWNGTAWVKASADASGYLNVNASVSVSGADGALQDGANAAIKATVKDYTNSNPLTVVVVDTNGDAVAGTGGGPATIADGADVAQGAIADAAVTGDNSGTLKAALRGLGKLFADVWDSVNHRLKVNVENATLAATQSGTWTVQPGNTANTTAWKVDGSAVTQPVSISGGATSAKQDTGNTSLASIDGKITAVNTGAVVISAALPAGANVIGHVIVDTTSTTAVTQATGTNLHTVVDSGTITTVSAVTAITNALPAGANAIGKLAANSGVDIGDIDVTSISAGDNNIGNVDIVTVPADPFGVNADAASATGSISAKLRFIAATGIPVTGTVTVASHAVTVASGGVASGAVASGAFASGALASGSIVAGAVAAGATSFVKLEDVASADADAGVPAMAIQKATPADTGGTDGDYTMLQMSGGRVWVDASGKTLTVAAHAVTNAGTFATQVDGAALTSLQLIDDIVLAQESTTSGQTGPLMQGAVTTAAPTYTTGKTDPLSLDTAGNLRVVLAASIVDDAAFTPATSRVVMSGFEADETSTDSVDEGDGGAARMTLDRKQIVTTQPHTSGGLLTFMASGSDGSTALTSTAQAVKASAGQVYGYYLYNPNATAQFVHFYNTAAGSVTVGTTNPQFTLTVPATSAANLMGANGIAFTNAGFSIAATATAGGNGAPSTALDAVVWYI